MSAMKKANQSIYFHVRISECFKQGMERAAKKAGLPTVSEFIRAAIIKAAAEYGVKIDRLK